MKEVTGVIAEVRAIPRKRLVEKIAKSAAGLMFMAFAIFASMKLQWTMWVCLGIFGVGAHIFSEEWTRKAVKFILAVVKDLLNAIRGDKTPPDDVLSSGTHPTIKP